MMMKSVTFGILCGATAAVSCMTAGTGLLPAFAAYSLAGALGMLTMAATAEADL